MALDIEWSKRADNSFDRILLDFFDTRQDPEKKKY